MLTSPDALASGPIVIFVPHMDDEILGCGCFIARTSNKDALHFIYATDGAHSHDHLVPGNITIDYEALKATRKQEVRDALDVLGVEHPQLTFLDFPDGQLQRHKSTLADEFTMRLQAIQPALILIPFRYDRHPDHLAVSEAAINSVVRLSTPPRVLMYFVYFHWRELPGGDVRQYIAPQVRIEIDSDDCNALKREALAAMPSQVTRFYDWQTRPVVAPAMIEESLQGREIFAQYEADGELFAYGHQRIRIIHLLQRLQPRLKRVKTRVMRLAGRRP